MLENPRSHADGSYFSVQVNDVTFHGDAWAWATFLGNANPEISRQELLYVGQAFGQGNQNAWMRTKRHETLQRIYEDHSGQGWDIFVAPIIIEHTSMTSDDHIDDMEDGPELDGFYSVFTGWDGKTLKPSVDLIEHSLISFFSPHYNSLLKEWNPGNPTAAMRRMRNARFRLLQVHLNGWEGMARFYTASRLDLVKGRYISQDIPPGPRAVKLSGISAESVSDWRAEARMIEIGPVWAANSAEGSGVRMKIFGPSAPAVRVPPEVIF